MRHVANFCIANEFRSETKTRTLPAINAKGESKNRQSVCRRSAKKQDPPYGQKTHRLAQTKPTVSTQSGCGPCAILFPCHFRLAPKLGRRSAIAKFTYCRHSRKIPAPPSNCRTPLKMNKFTSIQLLDMAIGTELGTAKEAEVEANFHPLGTLSRWLLARSDYPEMEAIQLFAKVRAYVAQPERFL